MNIIKTLTLYLLVSTLALHAMEHSTPHKVIKSVLQTIDGKTINIPDGVNVIDRGQCPTPRCGIPYSCNGRYAVGSTDKNLALSFLARLIKILPKGHGSPPKKVLVVEGPSELPTDPALMLQALRISAEFFSAKTTR